LLLLAVVTLGFTALFTALTVAQWGTLDPGRKAQVLADPGAWPLVRDSNSVSWQYAYSGCS
jgi:hypothetical protein